jgi:hypothetical protein
MCHPRRVARALALGHRRRAREAQAIGELTGAGPGEHHVRRVMDGARQQHRVLHVLDHGDGAEAMKRHHARIHLRLAVEAQHSTRARVHARVVLEHEHGGDRCVQR